MTAISVSSPLRLTRARRLALAVGVPVCLLLVALTGLNLVADIGQGSFPVSYTAPAAARSLTLHVSAGQVSVWGAPGPARVSGTAQYSLVRPNTTERAPGGAATVGYGCGFPFGTCSLDVAAHVPAGMPVTVSTGAGALSVSHLSGSLRLSTGAGDIVGPDTTAARVTAQAGDGSINLNFDSPPLDVHARTSSGDIYLWLPPGGIYHVIAHTDSGWVDDTVRRSPSSPYTITATTGSGNIRILYSDGPIRYGSGS